MQCHGKRIAKGSVKDSHGIVSLFAPDGLKFGLRPARGMPVRSFACLDCGFIWSSTEPKKLETFIRKHCDQDIGED
jgi:hypothetical protein